MRNKRVAAQQRCRVSLLVLALLAASVCLAWLLRPLVLNWWSGAAEGEEVPLENLNQGRPTDPADRNPNLCLLDSDPGMCMAAMPRAASQSKVSNLLCHHLLEYY